MKYYKFLTVDNKGKYSKYDFTKYLPHGGKPGKWLRKIDSPILCNSGYHCFTPEHIFEWAESQLFEVEIRGDRVQGDNKIAAQQMRFIRKIDVWNDKTIRLFACYCARDVLPIFEREYPNDNRPRIAIETAERYADSHATKDELIAAWDAARDAARDAAWDAEWAAAWDAARDAARDAAWDAARAAESAAARDAAWDAARAAEWAAARAAAWDAARAAEWDEAWDKYTNHLLEMLGISDET